MPKKPTFARFQCAKCKEWIQSKNEYQYSRCKCGAIWMLLVDNKPQIGGDLKDVLLPNGRSLAEEKERRDAYRLKVRSKGRDDDTKEIKTLSFY
jgi:DNA-directed RNA polymerase subunit RPC12/RpoP